MNKLVTARTKRKDLASKHIHPKLRRSLRLYLLISLIVLILVIVSAIRADANWIIVLGGGVTGTIVGVLFSRIYKISWDKDADHAIYKMDVLGIILLLAYIAFDINRSHLVEIFINGNSAGATSLALLAGVFYGRVLGTGREIIRVFRKEKVL